jgi:preprotein translocase subunit SecG
METILRVFQVFLAIGLIGVVLLQRSEGGGLGIGSSGGMGSFMSVRGTANFLTRVTGILAALFMITCLALALLARPRAAPQSIFTTPAPAPVSLPASDSAPAPVIPPAEAPSSEAAPAVAPVAPAPEAPSAAPAPQAATPAPQQQPQMSTQPSPKPATQPKPKKPQSQSANHPAGQ